MQLTEEQFQSRVMRAVDKAEETQQKVYEDLTKVKNANNDFSKRLRAIERARLNLNATRSHGTVTAIQRIQENEEKRARLNCAVRLAMDSSGDMARTVEPLMRSLGEDSSPGSTLITDELGMDIYDSLASYGGWNTLGVRRLGTKTTKFPVKTTRPVANWILTEGGTISDDSSKAGTSVTATVEVCGVLINVSRQLLDDADYDVTQDVLEDFSEAYNERVDHSAFVGDGTADATHGGMTGLFNFGTAVNAATGNTTVETLDFDDVISCLTGVDAAVLGRKPKWWVHPHMLARLMSVKDGNGRPIFLTAIEAPAFGSMGSILGFPVEMIQKAPNTNSAGNPVMAFGDPKAYLVGMRQDFSFEASDHHRWNTYERSFRGVGRACAVGRKASAIAVLTLAAS